MGLEEIIYRIEEDIKYLRENKADMTRAQIDWHTDEIAGCLQYIVETFGFYLSYKMIEDMADELEYPNELLDMIETLNDDLETIH